MERAMRRKDRQLTTAEAESILKVAVDGVLSTVSEEGQPYGVPLNFVYEGQDIYFHCAVEGHKLDNIRYNDRVCFTVYDVADVIPEDFTTRYRSAVVFGKAVFVEGEEKLQALRWLIKKYSPGHEVAGEEEIRQAVARTAVIKIVPEYLTGKGNRQ